MIKDYDEKLHEPKKGWAMLVLLIFLTLACLAMMVMGAMFMSDIPALAALLPVGIVCIVVLIVFYMGLCVIEPNEAVVLIFFGRYLYTVARTVSTSSIRSRKSAGCRSRRARSSTTNRRSTTSAATPWR